ncbi:MAG: DUF1552 domain-containing protein [Myxococcota bacterium]
MRRTNETIKRRHVSRRQFLIGAGGSALALPPLFSLMPDALAANAAGGTKVRAVIFTGMLGIDPHQLFPSEVPTFTEVPGVESLRRTALSEFGGGLSRVIDDSFVPIYDKMNLYHGMSLTGGKYQGHNESILSGTHSGARSPEYGKSIDVVLEKSPSVYSPDEVVARKAVRLVDGHHLKGFSFDRVDGKRRVSSSFEGDRNMFNALFADLGNTNEGPSIDDTNQQLIVDRVLEDLRALEKNTRLSNSDSQILESYIDGVQDVQKKVLANINGDAAICEPPGFELEATTDGNRYKFPYDSKWGVNDVGVMYDNIMEMTRLAFACDLTRVIFIGCTLWDDRPIGAGSDGGLHHECPSSETSANRQRYGLKKLAQLAMSMNNTVDPHGEGSLLDNSILFWTNELGAWTTAHSTLNIPAITFGSGGGYFKTGHYLDYRQLPLKKPKGYHNGRPYKQLLQSVMRSMGVAKSEYTQFGDGNGFGEFKPGIAQFGYNDPDVFARYQNEHNDPLPWVTNEG